MGRARPARPSQPTSPTLPWLIGLLAVTFTGLIVNDHVLPALRPEPAASAAAARATGSPAAGLALGPGLPRGGAGREWPLLTGVAAERAMRERQREAALGKLQHPPDPYLLPPAL